MAKVIIGAAVVSIFSLVNCAKLSCNDGFLGPNAETVKALGACKDPNIWGMEAGKKNPNCDQLCQAAVFEYLAPDGTINQDLYFKWIEEDFGTEQNQQFAKQHITGCFEKFGSKIDLSDPTCEMVKKFDDCGWSMVPNLKC